jgi:hypothetical protein
MVIPNSVPVDGSIWTKEFWVATAERAIRTGAAAGAIELVGNAYQSVQLNALYIDWVRLVGFIIGGALISVLMSIGANAKTGNGPSFTSAEKVTAPPRRALPDVGEEGP